MSLQTPAQTKLPRLLSLSFPFLNITVCCRRGCSVGRLQYSVLGVWFVTAAVCSITARVTVVFTKILTGMPHYASFHSRADCHVKDDPVYWSKLVRYRAHRYADRPTDRFRWRVTVFDTKCAKFEMPLARTETAPALVKVLLCLQQ